MPRKPIIVRPLRNKKKYWEIVRKEISRILFDVLFKGLIELTKKERAVLNQDTDALEEAIKKGSVFYTGTAFSGRFTAQISKELKSLGATFNRIRKTWKISKSQLSANVLSSMILKDENDKMLNDEALSEIDKTDIGKIDRDKGIDEAIDKYLDEIDVDFVDSLRKVTIPKGRKDITIHFKLSGDQKKVIGQDWTNNLKLFIKDFSKQSVLELREEILENTRQGMRAEGLVEIIQKQFGVSERKALFLAKQETSLLMAKYRETRFKEVGITEYIWSTSQDTRVRPSHKELNKQLFSFDSPPIVNKKGDRKNPGEDFGCRCVPKAVIR